MPMSKQLLGAAMKSAIDALSDDDKKDRTKVFEAMAGAIIEHIQLNATLAGPVLPGLSTGPGGGPVIGALATGPGVIK